MKKSQIVILIMFLFLPFQQSFAESQMKLLASIPKHGIALFAAVNPHKKIYDQFIMQRGKYTINFPDWTNVLNPDYPPKIYYRDVTNDNIKEVIVFLTEAYGPEMQKSSVHIIQKFREMSADRPVPFIEKSRETLGLKPDVSVGGIVYYGMENNHIIVFVNAGPDQLIKGTYRYANGELKLDKTELVKK